MHGGTVGMCVTDHEVELIEWDVGKQAHIGENRVKVGAYMKSNVQLNMLVDSMWSW